MHSLFFPTQHCYKENAFIHSLTVVLCVYFICQLKGVFVPYSRCFLMILKCTIAKEILPVISLQPLMVIVTTTNNKTAAKSIFNLSGQSLTSPS